jgi:hypothetical protein
MTPVLCPICTRSSLEEIFQNVSMEAKIDGDRVVGGLMAFRCTEFGHVFFVRRADVEADARFSVPT